VDYSRVLMLVAALNEEEGIGQTLSELKKTLDKPALSARFPTSFARFGLQIDAFGR